MIIRDIEPLLLQDLKPGHVTVLYGARRTGKTVLMQHLASTLSEKRILILNGEDYDVASMLASRRQSILTNLVAGYNCLFIDEAQNIPGIGASLKLLVDTNPQISVLATGSSAFDLRNQVGEPLTGRSQFWQLFPLSLGEIAEDFITATRLIPSLLVFGSYPQVFLAESETDKRAILENIRNGYLLKDVLQVDNVKDSLFVMDLLRILAFQIGNDVSYSELASSLKTTVKTVQRYLEILEKAFIIIRLTGYSRNLRKEVTKSPRFYFWDNGIRNAIISQFTPIDLREDKGKLWENFCVAERIKKQTYARTFSNFYFWRTYDQQEIDLLEEVDGKIYAFEIKYGNKPAKVPRGFATHYPDAIFQTINRENVYGFLVK